MLKPIKWAVLCTSALAAVCSYAADGQNAVQLAALSLDTLLDMPVSGASKFSQRASEAPASVVVIRADEIRAMGWRTLADVLSSLPGFEVSRRRPYTSLGVRGFVPLGLTSWVVLAIDGVRINDNIFGVAPVGSEFPLDLDLVERVEFISGPASAVYGANALLGVVNVVTRAPGSRSLEASLAAGSGASRSLRVGTSRRLEGGLSFAASVSRTLSRGGPGFAPDLEAAGVPDAPRGTDFERRSSVYLRAEQGPVSAWLLHSERDKGIPAPFPDARIKELDEQTQFNVMWQHWHDADNQLTVRGFFRGYDFQNDIGMLGETDSASLNGRGWGIEARWFTTSIRGHKLVAGAELEWSPQVRLSQSGGPDGRAIAEDTLPKSRRTGLFFEDQLELSDQWSVSAGGRSDITSGYARQFSPRIGLNWHDGKTMVVKLTHGRAFRPPNALELAGMDASGAVPDANVRNERVVGDELAVEWWPGAQERVKLSVYHNRAMLAARDAVGRRILSPTTAQGADLEVERLWSGGARLRASASVVGTSDSDAARSIASSAPSRMAKVGAVVPLDHAWRLGAEWQAASRRATAPGYGIVNLTLSRAWPVHGWSVVAGIADLFDRRRSDPWAAATAAAWPPPPLQDGRRWSLRLDYAF
ncbi:MAG TPA: TonB-dependent receptor [Burkholderiaceae bacterium]|nr:TonB-dependent receptor [Burkholderiaceae bacterium]